MSSVEERFEVNLNKFLALVIQNPTNKHLLGRLPVEVFSNESNIIATVLNRYKSKDINITPDFLAIYLKNNPSIIAKNPRVDKSILDEFSVNPVEEFIRLTLNHLDNLSNMKVDGNESVETLVVSIVEDYKRLELENSLNIAREIYLDGYSVGRKRYIGLQDSMEYLQDRVSTLKEIGGDKLSRPIVDATQLFEESEESGGMPNELVSDFGDIESLNELYSGGIRTGYFYNVLASPKTGKTKFCTRIVYNAITKYKTNCYVFQKEGGGYNKTLCDLRSIHFDEYYRKLGYNIEPLSSNQIKDKLYPDKNIEELEMRSFKDLMNNDSYGKLFFPDDSYDLNLDNLDEIMYQASVNNCKLVFIDYLSIIEFDYKKMNRVQAITLAYQKMARLVVKYNLAFISPSQMKIEFLKEANRIDDLADLETRSAAGESSEITRTPDVNIALYASPRDQSDGILYLLPYPSRVAGVNDVTKLYADLKICYFSDINED